MLQNLLVFPLFEDADTNRQFKGLSRYRPALFIARYSRSFHFLGGLDGRKERWLAESGHKLLYVCGLDKSEDSTAQINVTANWPRSLTQVTSLTCEHPACPHETVGSFGPVSAQEMAIGSRGRNKRRRGIYFKR